MHRTSFIAAMVTGLILLFGVSGFAKDEKHKKHQDPQAMMETYQKLATPGEPHEQLAKLAGAWTTHTKEWMEPGKPPTESTGMCDFTVLLDGRFVRQECTGQMMGQPFTGIGTHGYDNFTKKYLTTWMDSMATGIFSMEGKASADSKTIILHGSHADPFEGLMKHRAVWTFPDANTQNFAMYGSHKGGKEMKMMEITYTRKS
jgi:Protein of unknown function (DUF1579)